MTPLTVLLVEDSDVDAMVVTEMLGCAEGLGARVVRHSRLDTAMVRLAEGDVDVVLLDLSLPDSHRQHTFARIGGIAPGTPVIVMSSSRDDRLAVTAARNGAQDYLPKDQLRADQLRRAILCGLERHRLVSSIRELSLTDDLTGLYNRRGFLSLGTSHLHLAQRSCRRFILLYADLDGLKEINDTFGHGEGDRALATAAGILRSSFRLSDIIGRLGGDEFAVVAVEAAGDTEMTLAARLRHDLDRFNERSGLPYRLSLSAGVTGYDWTCTAPLEQRLADADRALYAVKGGRRSSARIHTAAR